MDDFGGLLYIPRVTPLEPATAPARLSNEGSGNCLFRGEFVIRIYIIINKTTAIIGNMDP